MKSKMLKILLSVTIALTLWLYVISVERTETVQNFRNVPVILDGESVLEDRGLKIVSDTDLTVDLELTGNRSELNKLRSSDIVVIVDLTRIYEAGEKELEYSVTLPGTIEVVSREPQTINIEVARWVTQEVPVQLEQVGSLPDNYIVDQQNVTLDRQFITLSGPQSVVENIAMAKVTVDMTGRTESVEERVSVTLCDENSIPLDVSSVTVDTDKVLVKIPVLMVKDIQLQVSVISGGGLTAQDVTVTLDKTEITVSGSPAVISKLEDVLVLGTIDLSQELEGFTDRTYQVELPAGVKNLSGIEEVQVSLEMPEREIQSFDLSMEDMLDRVELQNVPDGVPVRVRENQQLTVWIRGQAKDLEKVMITDFRIVVDLTGATQTGMYEAQILVENVSGVGVVSDPDDPYEILVQIGESGQTTPAS